jgi:HprK-related kinase A
MTIEVSIRSPAAIGAATIASRLRGAGLFLRTGPFVVRLRSNLPEIAASMALLYDGHILDAAEDFADFHVSVRSAAGPRGHIKPQIVFELDGEQPFEPFPRREAPAVLEWGLNWAISTYANHYLLIHAACVEKDGRAAIMPGEPGKGKSTLCAALVHNGWRLLSDELAVIELADGALLPLCRPMSLKNRSIAAIRDFAPDAVFGPTIADTRKGTLALLPAPPDSVRRMAERATAHYILFPSFSAGVSAGSTPRSRGTSLIALAENAFNYQVHGRRGFDRLADIAAACRCADFVYSDLGEAVSVMQRWWPAGELSLS